MEEIPLALIDDNPFNARQDYEDSETSTLANSIKQSGLLTPIKVRKYKERYQIVYGHRRVRASKALGHRKILADVIAISDQDMLDMSLVENLMRKNLSDYETAMSFEKMNKVFHKSYEEIARIAGYSKSHVGNYVRMLQLFDEESLAKNPNLLKEVKCITEHHARVLLRIPDQDARASALRLTLTENLSVRELERTVLKLRGWFELRKKNESDNPQRFQLVVEESDADAESRSKTNSRHPESHLDDLVQIQHTLNTIFRLPHEGNFEQFADLHAFESGFTIYSYFPPLQRLEKVHAVEKEQEWFYSVAPHLKASIQDLHIQFFGETALATLCVNYSGKSDQGVTNMTIRGTVVFVHKGDDWKIIHEHWSPLGGEKPLVSRF